MKANIFIVNNQYLTIKDMKKVFFLCILFISYLCFAFSKPLEFDLLEKDAINKLEMNNISMKNKKNYYITKFSYDNGFFKESVIQNKLNSTIDIKESKIIINLFINIPIIKNILISSKYQI